MKTSASWDLQIVEHGGESYLLLPRCIPSSYDIVRLKDQIGVGAVWLTQSEPGFRHAAAQGVSPNEIRKIVAAGIRAGLFAE